MINRTHGWMWVTAGLVIAVTLAACGSKEEPETAAPPQAAAAEPAAVPLTRTSAAPEDSETSAKVAAVKAALAEEAIASDPRGQWAVSATASSTYATDKAPEASGPYTPHASLGAPDVERFSDSGNAWAAETADKGIEWLEVKFANPVQATELRVRQSYWPGAIIKVEQLDEAGLRHTMWQGVDEEQNDGTIVWFKRSFAKTDYRVTGARITLATNAVPDWNQIDAVQLLGE